MLLQGIYPAITTPFYPDGRLYLKKLEHNVDRYSRTPVAGMVALGSTGEAVHLGDDEQREVLKLAAEVAAEQKVLVAGVGQESAERTLALTEFAAKAGYDVALVRTPSYYRPQMKSKPEAIVAYFRFVADRAPLPVLLYNVPPYTAYDLPNEAVTELASHPNILGIKESGGSVEKIAAMKQATSGVKRTVNVTEIFAAMTRRMLAATESATASSGMIPASALGATAGASVGTATITTPKPKYKMRTKEVGFQMAAGAAEKLLPSLDAGASAALLAFASCAPTACYEVYAAWKDRDQAVAEEKQRRIAVAAETVSGQFGVPGVKHACDLNGYYGGPCRLPLPPLTGAEKAEIENLMRDIRN
ncbi:MAG: dihydrodipicolinate synthase family protein [Acidobacteriales bacterium]|nr:dihydrodipicolinate synthase family protein [Terriglobales bacterium]